MAQEQLRRYLRISHFRHLAISFCWWPLLLQFLVLLAPVNAPSSFVLRFALHLFIFKVPLVPYIPEWFGMLRLYVAHNMPPYWSLPFWFVIHISSSLDFYSMFACLRAQGPNLIYCVIFMLSNSPMTCPVFLNIVSPGAPIITAYDPMSWFVVLSKAR